MSKTTGSIPLSEATPGTPAVTGRQKRRGLTPLAEVALVWGLVAVLVPLFLDGALLFLATTVVIYALFALSVNVLFGWTGISSFGQAAYFGAGAYAYALLSPHIQSPVLLVLAAGLVAGALALVFSVSASRITGVEFAMLTLVFGQILWLLTFRFSFLGGENGIPGVSRGTMFGLNLFDDEYFWWFVIGVVAICTYLLRRISGSSLGMSMSAVHDSPIRASALGINIRQVRVAAFSVAGVFGGVAGALFASQQGLVTPDLITWSLSGEVIVMCLVGGLATFWGPTIGALVFTLANWYLFDRVDSPLLFVGLVLLIVVLLVPEGIAGVFKKLTRRLRAEKGARRVR